MVLVSSFGSPDEWSTMPTRVTAGSSRGSCSRLRRKIGSAEKMATATMKVLTAPFSPQLRYGSLPDNHLEFGRCAAADQSQIDGTPDALGSNSRMASRTRSIGLPFQALTMSPTSNPARPEGPAGSMLTTRTPRPLLDPCDPLDSCPSWLCAEVRRQDTPAKHMAPCQELINRAVYRFLGLGIARARRRGPRTVIPMIRPGCQPSAPPSEAGLSAKSD